MRLDALLALQHGLDQVIGDVSRHAVIDAAAGEDHLGSAGARKAGVSPTTVTRFENGAHTRLNTLGQIQDLLERAGVIFVPADEAGGPGVRLREPNK